tara:strand:+ start:212 stop:679 length:468 start_codon:yes stop_codon:yes gene_type:complete
LLLAGAVLAGAMFLLAAVQGGIVVLSLEKVLAVVQVRKVLCLFRQGITLSPLEAAEQETVHREPMALILFLVVLRLRVEVEVHIGTQEVVVPVVPVVADRLLAAAVRVLALLGRDITVVLNQDLLAPLTLKRVAAVRVQMEEPFLVPVVLPETVA